MKYKTLRRIVVNRSHPASIAVYHKGKVTFLRRRCPHQGGPLDQGYFDGDFLLCPWHGCRFPLTRVGPPIPYVPMEK